jgi:hypothetical protein
VTGQGYGMCIGGCNKLCSAAMGHGLVALFSLSMSIEDHLLLWILVRSHIYYLEIISSIYLLMEAGRLVTHLSWIPALSGPTDWRR